MRKVIKVRSNITEVKGKLAEQMIKATKQKPIADIVYRYGRKPAPKHLVLSETIQVEYEGKYYVLSRALFWSKRTPVDRYALLACGPKPFTLHITQHGNVERDSMGYIIPSN